SASVWAAGQAEPFAATGERFSTSPAVLPGDKVGEAARVGPAQPGRLTCRQTLPDAARHLPPVGRRLPSTPARGGSGPTPRNLRFRGDPEGGGGLPPLRVKAGCGPRTPRGSARL